LSGDRDSTAGRSSVELLDFPFAFWQLPTLTAQKFIEAGRERGVYLTPDQLEALHRMGILHPFLRVGRDLRAASAAIRRQDPWRFELIHSVPTQADGLREARAEGRLYDPRDEPFIARSRLRRERDGQIYQASPTTSIHLISFCTCRSYADFPISATPARAAGSSGPRACHWSGCGVRARPSTRW
jgi:hypothetical protein